MAALPPDQRRLRIPAITDPRGTDFAAAHRLKQQPWMLDLERRAIAAFEALGVLMTNTCINYQTIMPPVFGEHVAYGDTGVVIYSNSVCGARSNFEGGPSALSAAVTGHPALRLSPRRERRAATLVVDVGFTPARSTIGARSAPSSAASPATIGRSQLVGVDRVPGSDEMKHFGAALASYGSVALFHMVGITPEARREADIMAANATLPRHEVGEADIRALRELQARHRPRRSRRVLGAAIEPGRDAAGRRPARGPPRHRAASRGHEPTGQAGRRSAWA